MKVLVLGATGFIGNHVARELLSRGHEVHVLHRASSDTRLLEGLPVHRHIGELSDGAALEAAMRGADGVVHSAAPSPAYVLGIRREVEAALRLIRSVLDAARKAGVGKFLYTGSPPILHPGTPGPAGEENHYTGPVRSAYFRMKLALDAEVLRAAREGLPASVLKCGACFGERDVKPSMGSLLLMAARRRLPMYADVPLSAVDIRDIARGHAAALERARPGETYMLGGENTTLRPVLEAAARAAGVPPPRRVPPGVVRGLGAAIGYPAEAVSKLLRRPEPAFPLVSLGLVKWGCHMDSSKAGRELGYTHGPAAPAVERAVQWFKEQRYF